MAKIRAFRAYRPCKDMAAQIAALPYDVYNKEEAREYVSEHPDSFLAIDRPETTLDPDCDMYAKETYMHAAQMLQSQIADGKFIKEEEPCLYLYELTMNSRVQTGIVACVSVDDYDKGVVKKHENTLAAKEEDRVNHIDHTSMQTGPIFLAYRDNKALSDIVLETKRSDDLYDITSEDGIRHRVWKISEPAVMDAIIKEMDAIGNVYIADGHHRAASAVRVSHMRREAHPEGGKDEEYNYFLSVLFPAHELKILDYNRVVKDLNGFGAQEFLKELDKVAEKLDESDEAIRPTEKGQFSVALSGKWYLYSFKAEVRSEDAVEGLDVSILQKYVLTPILGIKDPRTDSRIAFVGGIRGLDILAEMATDEDFAGDEGVAFAMYPTSIDELLKVADESRLMPPKSTWFEPKLRSGIFLHEIEK
ncbi:MAG: DUF1015 domain-containing protein [Lachnospiraceae bacterium]|nr:DUF1015 domain-containing protein [Lachnospiraceae bacterium]